MWANSIDSQLDMKGGWVTKSYEASELGHSVFECLDDDFIL